MLFGAKMADLSSLRNVPSSEATVAAACQDCAGFVPYYLVRMLHSNARSAFVWAFTLRLCEGSEEVPVSLKQLMCYICATNAGNNILRAHYAFMAFRSGVPIRRLATIASNDADSDVAADKAVGAKEVAAMALAEAASGTPSTMSPTLIGLLMRQYSPAAVIELIITVSVAFMFHRWTSVYMPREYEPEVLKFLLEYGPALRIDPAHPCSEEQSKWEQLASTARGTVGHE